MLRNLALMTLVSFLISTGIATPLQAGQNNGVFLSYSASKKLTKDIVFYKKNYPKLEQSVLLLERTNSSLIQQNGLLILERSGLEKDKEVLLTVSSEFKKKYVETNEQLGKCEESKPSRMTWFGIGFVSAAILGIVGALAIK